MGNNLSTATPVKTGRAKDSELTRFAIFYETAGTPAQSHTSSKK